MNDRWVKQQLESLRANKSFLIQFTIYCSGEGEHDFTETIRLVRAETYEKAVEKLNKEFVLGNIVELRNIVNLTIE